MKFTRAVKLVLTELRFLKRGVGWYQFIVFVVTRFIYKLRQWIIDPNAFKLKWMAITMPSDATGLYGRIRLPEAPVNLALQVAERTINWVIPDFGIGHGGVLNILRFVLMLERHGYLCRIYIDGPSRFSSGAKARLSIRKHYGPIEADVTLGADAMAPAEYTFATTWRTAYTVRAFGDTRFKCYFVQDFEPFFYARGSEYVFAENTYRFGFIGITAGRWLAERLRTDYGMRTFPLGFSYDKALYTGDNPLPKMNERTRIFFYARPTTPRRGFDLGILVLAEVVKRHPEVEIVMAGWELSAYSIPFRYVDMGALSLDALPDLFRSCDIALVLSYSNVSLLPLELMACGCSVVSNKGDNVEWLLNERVALLVESDVSAIANAICSLIENPEARMALQKAALDFCRSTDWEGEGLRLHNFLLQVRQESASHLCASPGCDTL